MKRIEAPRNGEKLHNIGTSSPLLRKTSRNHISISSSAPLSSHLSSNPEDLPELFTCHSCGIVNDGLRALESEWRVVLVCKGCHDRIRSAAVCSYCFNAHDVDVLVCRNCLCRVHLRCVHIQRGYTTLSEYDPASFTCIDCRAIPRPQFRNLLHSRALLEDLVRNVSCAAKKKVALAAKARLEALKKADDARVAIERAFDAIVLARDAAVEDEQLAVQLHLSMNGSTRVLRRTRQSNLGNFIPVKKDYDSIFISSLDKKPPNWRQRVPKKLGICRNNGTVLKSNKKSLSKRTSYVKPEIPVKEELLEIDVHYASCSLGGILAKKGRHFDVLLNCDESNNDGLALVSCRESADSNSLMEISECGTGEPREDSPNLQEGCTVPCHSVNILLENS